jgi:hypothetical protein
MECGLYTEDDLGEINNFNTISIKTEGEGNDKRNVFLPTNSGFLKRRKVFIDSNGVVDVIIPLHCGIFHSDRLLKDNIPQ